LPRRNDNSHSIPEFGKTVELDKAGLTRARQLRPARRDPDPSWSTRPFFREATRDPVQETQITPLAPPHGAPFSSAAQDGTVAAAAFRDSTLSWPKVTRTVSHPVSVRASALPATRRTRADYGASPLTAPVLPGTILRTPVIRGCVGHSAQPRPRRQPHERNSFFQLHPLSTSNRDYPRTPTTLRVSTFPRRPNPQWTAMSPHPLKPPIR